MLLSSHSNSEASLGSSFPLVPMPGRRRRCPFAYGFAGRAARNRTGVMAIPRYGRLDPNPPSLSLYLYIYIYIYMYIYYAPTLTHPETLNLKP